MTQALKDLLTRVRLGSFDAEADILEMFRSATAAAQPVATKKTYIKPLRTIVEIDERYADKIRDLLNGAAVPAPQTDGAAGVAQTAPDMRSALQLLTSLDRIAESFRNVEPCRHNNDNLIGDLKIELAGLREALVGPSISSTDSKYDGADDLEHLDGMLDDRERG